MKNLFDFSVCLIDSCRPRNPETDVNDDVKRDDSCCRYRQFVVGIAAATTPSDGERTASDVVPGGGPHPPAHSGPRRRCRHRKRIALGQRRRRRRTDVDRFRSHLPGTRRGFRPATERLRRRLSVRTAETIVGGRRPRRRTVSASGCDVIVAYGGHVSNPGVVAVVDRRRSIPAAAADDVVAVVTGDDVTRHSGSTSGRRQ